MIDRPLNEDKPSPGSPVIFHGSSLGAPLSPAPHCLMRTSAAAACLPCTAHRCLDLHRYNSIHTEALQPFRFRIVPDIIREWELEQRWLWPGGMIQTRLLLNGSLQRIMNQHRVDDICLAERKWIYLKGHNAWIQLPISSESNTSLSPGSGSFHASLPKRNPKLTQVFSHWATIPGPS